MTDDERKKWINHWSTIAAGAREGGRLEACLRAFANDCFTQADDIACSRAIELGNFCNNEIDRKSNDWKVKMAFADERRLEALKIMDRIRALKFNEKEPNDG